MQQPLLTLDNKPVIGTTEEDLRLDLTYPSRSNTFVYDDTFAVEVKAGEEMRPDILSVNFFASPSYYDMILKRNGISNPFSINSGEIFFAPDLDDLMSNNAPSGRQWQAQQSVRQQYINPEKRSLTDSRLAIVEAQRLAAMRKKAETSVSAGSLLPPNIADAGDREIVVKGGKIYFGRDVVKGKEECVEPLTKSEFLARLVKNRIKRT
jgi:hypothetical protein